MLQDREFVSVSVRRHKMADMLLILGGLSAGYNIVGPNPKWFLDCHFNSAHRQLSTDTQILIIKVV